MAYAYWSSLFEKQGNMDMQPVLNKYKTYWKLIGCPYLLAMPSVYYSNIF